VKALFEQINHWALLVGLWCCGSLADAECVVQMFLVNQSDVYLPGTEYHSEPRCAQFHIGKVEGGLPYNIIIQREARFRLGGARSQPLPHLSSDKQFYTVPSTNNERPRGLPRLPNPLLNPCEEPPLGAPTPRHANYRRSNAKALADPLSSRLHHTTNLHHDNFGPPPIVRGLQSPLPGCPEPANDSELILENGANTCVHSGTHKVVSTLL